MSALFDRSTVGLMYIGQIYGYNVHATGVAEYIHASL